MSNLNELSISYENSTNPEQPEYGKGYKPWLHAGCCGSCGEMNCHAAGSSPASQTVITQRKTREDFLIP